MVHSMKPPDDDWWAYRSKGKSKNLSTYQTEGKTAGGPDWTDPFGGERCYSSHKPLLLGSTGLVIHGGSCITPGVTDADVYIGFDSGMRLTSRSWPWTPGDEILFKINDGHAPSDPAQFRTLVDWTQAQLQAGRKVHCGCIGGHGRTGTFLAALVCQMTGETNAIAYVRDGYCKKVVETAEQVAFLVKHYGIVDATPRHDVRPFATGGAVMGLSPPAIKDAGGKDAFGREVAGKSSKKSARSASPVKSSGKIQPIKSPLSIWGE